MGMKKHNHQHEDDSANTSNTHRDNSIKQKHSEPSIFHLQQSVGNNAIGSLLASKTIQAKLKVSQSNDEYEKEADRVSQEVFRSNGEPKISNGQSVRVNRKSRDSSNQSVSSEIESQIKRKQGAGKPLTRAQREFYEPRFGHDFRDVRVHTDSEANTINRALNAHAFTLNGNIYVDQQFSNFNSQQGRVLLAHELTHVIQQSKGKLSNGGPAKRGFSDTIQRWPPEGMIGEGFPVNWDNRSEPWRAGGYEIAISLHGMLSLSPFGIEFTGDEDGLFFNGPQSFSLNFSSGEFHSFETEVEAGPLSLGLNSEEREATLVVDVLGIVLREEIQQIVERIGEVTSDFTMAFAYRDGEIVLSNIGMDLGLRVGPEQAYALSELSIATEYPEEGPATTTAEGSVSLHLNICGIQEEINVLEGESRVGEIRTRHEGQLRQFALREAFSNTFNDLPGTADMSLAQTRSYLLNSFNIHYGQTYRRLHRRVVRHYEDQGFSNANEVLNSNLTPLDIFSNETVIVHRGLRQIIEEVILRNPEPPGREVVHSVWNSIILPVTSG